MWFTLIDIISNNRGVCLMRKFLVLLAVFLLSVSMVFAAGSGSGQDSGTGATTPIEKSVEPQQGSEIKSEVESMNKGNDSQIRVQERVQEGNPEIGKQVQEQDGSKKFMNQNGIEMEIRSENGQKLKVGQIEAKSSLELTGQEGSSLKAKLSNGKDAEIKVMPNTASEKAIERLRLKNCAAENGCTIELKEVGSGEQAKAAYEVKAQKESKVLGLFKAKMEVRAQIDAENGEVIKMNKPWWAFLASEE